jgi:uncharacterized membrane protein YfbV (UPF0208 family)
VGKKAGKREQPMKAVICCSLAMNLPITGFWEFGWAMTTTAQPLDQVPLRLVYGLT